jgi:hypothetical protein
MSTRNLTMVVHRRESEKYVKGFALNPIDIADKSYVNMYLHHDGYPEYRAVELANWIKHMQEDEGFTNFGDGSRIASHMVKDFHYNSQYLYPSVESIDHHYTYIIWVGKPDVWISCWNQHTDACVFVTKVSDIFKGGWFKPEKFDYTDWKLYKQNIKTNR